jgi:hypothetical protein
MPRTKAQPVVDPITPVEIKLARVPSTPYLVDLETGVLYLSPELLGELQKLYKK